MLSVLIMLIALAAIVWGADTLVNGSVAIARRYRISDFVIGAVIVGIGTSCPELVVSSYGALQGNVDVAIGNVVGSNIFNVLFILGVSSQLSPLTGGGITVVDYAVMIAAVVLLFVVSLKGRISRMSGAVMLLSFIGYLYYLISLQ